MAQVTIENLCFDGSSTGDAIHGEANGTNASLSQIEIKGNWINGGNRGIYLTQTGTAGIYHVKVEDNLVFNTASEGIFLNATATGLVSQIQIEKNWVLHFGTASAGLKLHNVQNVAVRNNQVSDSASTVGGIVADNLSASEISGNDVESVNGAGSYAHESRGLLHVCFWQSVLQRPNLCAAERSEQLLGRTESLHSRQSISDGQGGLGRKRKQ